MPSFKRIFSVVWYVWNWRNLGQVLFVFLGGLFFLFGAAYYGMRDRLPSTPEAIDLASAHELVRGTRPRYVLLAAEPDFSKKIYRTGIWAPFWGNCPPNEIRQINAADISAADLRKLLGCAVALTGRIDIGDARTVRWPAHGAADDVLTVALAPVKGTRELVWVKSKLAPGARADISAWQTQETFSGILATYDQALAALPEGFAGHARQVLPALADAFVVCPGEPYTGKSLDYFISHFWMPVRGSDSIFLWTSTDEENTYGRTIAGVLVPLARTDHEARDRSYAHFEVVTGRPLPDRIGVIEYPTAEAYNRKLSGYSGVFMIFGVLWTVCGLIGIVLYIVAPGLIYNAWKRALQTLSSGAPAERRTSVRPGPPPPSEATAETCSRGLEVPFQSPGPVSEEPSARPPRPAMDVAFKSLRRVDPGEKELYLAFIQDFTHHKNPDCGLRMISCGEDIQTVENELINEGQRYPGLAIRLLGVNREPLSDAGCLPPHVLTAFELRAYDYVVLCHAPSPWLIERVVITDVCNGWADDDARRKAEAALTSRPVFALMGRVCLIGDSENGPCQALTKKPGSSLLLPAQ